jgi:hypothetical protein
MLTGGEKHEITTKSIERREADKKMWNYETTPAQDEASIAMDAASPTAPTFVVWHEGRIVRLATNEEIARFRAQHKHLVLCRPMALTNGEWMGTHYGNKRGTNQPYSD